MNDALSWIKTTDERNRAPRLPTLLCGTESGLAVPEASSFENVVTLFKNHVPSIANNGV